MRKYFNRKLYDDVGGNHLVSTTISETHEDTFDSMSVTKRAEQLLALPDRRNSIPAKYLKKTNRLVVG